MTTTSVIIDEESRRRANIRLLQRIDANITEVLGSATHVVLYEFHESNKNWEKKNCEGALFIVKTSNTQRFRMIILNRLGSDNLNVDVTERFQLQERDPYLIFRQDIDNNSTVVKRKIMGVWFHEGKERETISTLLRRVIQSFSDIKNENFFSKVDDASTNETDSKSKDKANYSQAVASLLSSLRIGGSDDGEATASQQKNVQEESINNKAPLDKKSLQLALLSLIQDDRFIDIIHAQYLRVVKAREANGQQNPSTKK